MDWNEKDARSLPQRPVALTETWAWLYRGGQIGRSSRRRSLGPHRTAARCVWICAGDIVEKKKGAKMVKLSHSKSLIKFEK